MAKKPQKLWLRWWVCVTAFPRNTAVALPTSLQCDLSHMRKSSHPPEGLECQYSSLDLRPYAVNLPVAAPCLPASHSQRLTGERRDSTHKQFASNLERQGPRGLCCSSLISVSRPVSSAPSVYLSAVAPAWGGRPGQWHAPHSLQAVVSTTAWSTESLITWPQCLAVKAVPLAAHCVCALDRRAYCCSACT